MLLREMWRAGIQAVEHLEILGTFDLECALEVVLIIKVSATAAREEQCQGCCCCQSCHNTQFSSTTQINDRRALTCQSSKTPRHQSQGQTAVRCIDLVRQSNV